MIRILKTNDKTKKLEDVKTISKGVWINLCAPTREELDYVTNKTMVDKTLLEYALDIEERSHIDTEDDQVLVSINVPVLEKVSKRKTYTTVPLGMIVVGDDYFITVSTEKLDILDKITTERLILGEFSTYKKSRIVFQVLYKASEDYIRYLALLNKDIEKFEDKLEKTMKNQELMYLISFQKTMVYFDTSVKSNQTVMERLKRGKIIKLYEEDEDILEDAAIENRQAMEMVTTYSEILNGMIDVFGTMISNNLNTVMRFLTSITIIIAVPTLIASIMGMNVAFPFKTTTLGFYIVMLVSVIVTAISTWYLKRKDML